VPGGVVAGVPDLPWPCLVVVPGDRRGNACDAAADAGPRCPGAAAVWRGLLAADSAVRREHHRADARRELPLHGGLRLRVPVDYPRRDGDLHAALLALR